MIYKIVFYDEENHKWSVPLWKKLVIFYNAPISKFWAHLVSIKDFASIFLFYPTVALVIVLLKKIFKYQFVLCFPGDARVLFRVVRLCNFVFVP